jgi:hypothetical protein
VLTLGGGHTADSEAINTVMGRYFSFMDAKRWDDLRDLFTDDMAMAAPDDVPDASTVVGRDRVVKVIRAVLGPAVTVHQGRVVELEFVGADRARGVCAMHDTVTYPHEPARSFRGSGHYLADYARTESGWKIRALTLHRVELDRG